MVLIYGLKQILSLSGNNNPKKGKLLSEISVIENGAILIENGKIIDIGREKEVFKNKKAKNSKKIKISGVAMPSFIDSHTHSIFAKARLKDFSLRTSGYSYQEIKKKGGGILSSVKSLRNSDRKTLVDNLLYFSKKFIENGTGVIEAKSGYGLNLDSEIKILETIKEASSKTKLEIIPTFLGPHALAPEFKNSKEYLDYIIKKILPEIKNRKLAVFSDIFCEDGYFSVEESVYYLKKAKEFGLIPKIHAEQLKKYGGSKAAIEVNAISADHMDYTDLKTIKKLAKTNTIITFLPASNYFLGLEHYPNSRDFIDKGAAVALATDFNPGTSPCYNMQFVISVAVTHMKMKIEEAINAAIYNGACALNIQNRTGSLEIGKQADISIFDIKDYRELAYYFGSNLCKMTIKKGEIIYEKENSAI